MALTEEVIKKRLKAINSTQDCIQTTSLWVIHHKESCIDKIAKCWMDVYKQANDNLRIALIYVMNDVVQRVGKKDRHDSVKMAFHPHVVNAFAMASKTVKKTITRDEIGFRTKTYFQNAELTEKARNILERSDFNFRDKMADKMKDRVGGTKILNEMDDSRNNQMSENDGFDENCKMSLNLQLRDVTVVDDAYEKFAIGIKDTKKELEEAMKTGIFPGMSPPRDAPSPAASDDPFAMQGMGEDAAGSAEDMDIDDGMPILDPRLQRLINQKSRADNNSNQLASPTVIDPRQASRAPPIRPAVHQQPPPPNFFSPSTAMGTMHIDTSQPPPPFPPRPAVSPIFNPNTPPPFGNFGPEGPRGGMGNQ
uniref:CID domain-containing protein n=1 Tax=Ditylenchus dipsaci TaxID=166011 RepID=A0A915D9W2_9BILA